MAALVVFWLTRPDPALDSRAGSQSSPTGEGSSVASPSASLTSSQSPSSEPTTPATSEPVEPTKSTPRPIQRGQVTVGVLNASAVSGLAAEVTTQAASKGWRTLAPDNTGVRPPVNTVFFPTKALKRAAELLAKDLGISRVAHTPEGLAAGRLIVVLVNAP